ncbi:phosphoserine phosphatase SerB [Microbulbifer discodermiae]|uniref:phosphoserine phosphatase SerB n=1 Tax=Microbulbifer sp. 2201CG32-9 TaxID=3232309 RepID=UPI00345B8812
MCAERPTETLKLPLEDILRSSGDARVCALQVREGMAHIQLEQSGGVQLANATRTPEAGANSMPAAVTAPWCATLLDTEVNLHQLRRLLAFFATQGWDVGDVDTLAQRQDRTVLRWQIQSREPLQFAAAKHACLHQAKELNADLVLQPGHSQRPPRLAGFDMDSTLIDAEVIDELAKITGVGAEVAAITEAAMRGELDFRQSFKKRMGLLRGFPETELAQIAPQLPLKSGAGELLRALKTLGCKTAILSGGFSYFANFLQAERLPVDLVHANQLQFAGGKLTGEVVEPIVDAMGKRALLEEMAGEMGLELDRVIAVGDGANDIPMLSLGALGIAIHPKPKVRLEAPQAITRFGLDAALYLFGLNDQQIRALLP